MRVAVTRPEPGASATASRLAERGHEPILLTLSRIASIETPNPPDPELFDAVVLTSANAIRHAATEIHNRYRHLPCFAVGERTAAVARQAGFRDVASANGDARELAKLIAENAPAGATLLYLCGRRRRPELEAALGMAGYVVIPLETYATEPVDLSQEELSRPVDAVLLHSPYGAERFSAYGAYFASSRILCMSGQIADVLSPELRKQAEIAAQPDEESLLALLGHAY